MYEGHQVKVKVIGAKKVKRAQLNAHIRGRAENHGQSTDNDLWSNSS